MHHITLAQLREWQAEGKPYQLIDVREPEEHKYFNIGGELIPLGSILTATDRLASDRPVVVYCKRGIRSQIAIQRWAQWRPEVEFYNLTGGVYDMMTTA